MKMAMAIAFITFTLCISTAIAFNALDVFLLGIGYMPESVYHTFSLAREGCDVNSTDEDIKMKGVYDCLQDMLLKNLSTCEVLEGHLERCSQPFLDLYIPCLPEKSRDLPAALIRTTVSVIHGFCTSTGEILLELLNDCIFNYEENEHLLGENCKEETLMKKFKFNTVPTKLEVCQGVTETLQCLKQSVNYSCRSPKTREMFSVFYNATITICN